jgi:hypothetical protein
MKSAIREVYPQNPSGTQCEKQWRATYTNHSVIFASVYTLIFDYFILIIFRIWCYGLLGCHHVVMWLDWGSMTLQNFGILPHHYMVS